MDEIRVPEHYRDVHWAGLAAGLERYINQRIPTGAFLRAVLENDLAEAIGRAASPSMIALPELLAFLQTEAPRGCWGSKAAVAAWLGERSPEDPFHG
jgi:hypothetical protein